METMLPIQAKSFINIPKMVYPSPTFPEVDMIATVACFKCSQVLE
jgi:hypothetical protein